MRVGVVLIVVDGFLRDDDGFRFVVRGDAHLAAHAGDDPLGKFFLVDVKVDFELAGADGDGRDRFHFAGNAVFTLGGQGDFRLLADGDIGAFAFFERRGDVQRALLDDRHQDRSAGDFVAWLVLREQRRAFPPSGR